MSKNGPVISNLCQYTNDSKESEASAPVGKA